MATASLTIPEAAQVAEVSQVQLRRWLDAHRGDSPGHIPRTALGTDALISRRTVMQLALAARLVEIGIAVRTALDAGLEFAHTGDEEREPCAEYVRGSTWIVHNIIDTRIVMIGDGLAGAHADAHNSLDDALKAHPQAEELAHAVLNLTGFVAKIDDRIAWVLRTMRPRNTRLRGATE